MKKGMKLSEWLDEHEMSPREITTARVFLVIGLILGLVIGMCGALIYGAALVLS